MTATDIIALLALLVSVAAAFYAGLAPIRNHHDSQVSQQAILALERAYLTLTQNGGQLRPPPADRLNWLTAARGIQDYKMLRGRLKTALYRQLCDANEHHWRHQFYLALATGNAYQPAYFIDGQLEKSSAAVVFAFSSWSNRRDDPLDDVDIDALFEESNALRMNVGLRHFLGHQ
jgi:hypothetical protein